MMDRLVTEEGLLVANSINMLLFSYHYYDPHSFWNPTLILTLT